MGQIGALTSPTDGAPPASASEPWEFIGDVALPIDRDISRFADTRAGKIANELQKMFQVLGPGRSKRGAMFAVGTIPGGLVGVVLTYGGQMLLGQPGDVAEAEPPQPDNSIASTQDFVRPPPTAPAHALSINPPVPPADPPQATLRSAAPPLQLPPAPNIAVAPPSPLPSPPVPRHGWRRVEGNSCRGHFDQYQRALLAWEIYSGRGGGQKTARSDRCADAADLASGDRFHNTFEAAGVPGLPDPDLIIASGISAGALRACRRVARGAWPS